MAFRMKYGSMAAAATAALAAAPAPAQLYISQPDLRAASIEPSDPLVGLPLPGATAAEYRAHLLWNLRAGLNVAALQCQFSDYLRAVPNYNGLLAHHSVELAAAYTALNNYYKRTLGAKGQKAFDDYSTITYNNWSSAQAQQIFCQTATNITKSALAAPKGQLFPLAQSRLRELRNALVPVYDPRPAYRPYLIRLKPLPPMAAECYTKKDLLRRACGGTAK
ncbi:MAG: hypothetical protein QOG72_3280 [Sphingomonadales bacterium]|jgi:hypothetical protein|nr:hypothetical protein [Sphingomonadales bacterium]